MNAETAQEKLEDLIAQSNETDDFGEFSKLQRKIITAQVRVAFEDARAQADLRREKAEFAEAEKAELDRQRLVVLEFQQRLEKHFTDDYDKLLDHMIATFKTGDKLFTEVCCATDLKLDAGFISLFRTDYHLHQMCRCLTTRGFRPIIDAIKDFYPGPLPDDVKMTDYLRGTVMDDAAPTNDGEVDK